MEVSAAATLLPVEALQVLIEKEVGWAPEPVWTLGEEKLLSLSEIEP